MQTFVEARGETCRHIGEYLSGVFPERAGSMLLTSIDGEKHEVYLIEDAEYQQLIALKHEQGIYKDIRFWKRAEGDKLIKPVGARKKAVHGALAKAQEDVAALS